MIGFAGLAVMAFVWLCIPKHKAVASLVERAGWSWLLRTLRIETRVIGGEGVAETLPVNALIIANHVSWTDIPVLAKVLNASFVAKSEVAGWPVLGWLARRHGCRFVDRKSRISAHDFAVSMSGNGCGERRLVLFAEGTTSDGAEVLPFRSSLLAATANRGDPVQPVTLVYRKPDGSALTPPERRRAAWLDDDALLPHFFDLAGLGGLHVEVWIESPVAASDRKELARLCHHAISERVASRNGGT